MDTTDPIRRVSAVSTGQVQIRPDHLASTWRPTPWWLLASRRWTGPRPINAYVIEHRDGLVLFDAGQDRASVTDPGYCPGGMTGVLYGRSGPVRDRPGRGPDRRELSHADLVVSQAEWDTLSGPLPGLRDSTAMINTMRLGDPGLVILPAHDPAAAAAWPRPPAWLRHWPPRSRDDDRYA